MSARNYISVRVNDGYEDILLKLFFGSLCVYNFSWVLKSELLIIARSEEYQQVSSDHYIN